MRESMEAKGSGDAGQRKAAGPEEESNRRNQPHEGRCQEVEYENPSSAATNTATAA